MRFNTRTIAENAIIACAYAVLTLAISPLAYSEIQFRLSEIMIFFAYYNKKWIPGLTVGCLLANLASPLGLYDIFFGTLSTLIVCILLSRTNNRYVGAFEAAIVTGIIIGFELHLAFGIPYLINAVYVAIGELGVAILGAVLFGYIEKNKRFIHLIKEG